mmetsp:Transcript_31387/g.102364  ORF Transcript_31387/g.102364 Transcript_31387/m.102364 type:complete len:212 (+) Transcript_31387:1072-1707(+)
MVFPSRSTRSHVCTATSTASTQILFNSPSGCGAMYTTTRLRAASAKSRPPAAPTAPLCSSSSTRSTRFTRRLSANTQSRWSARSQNLGCSSSQLSSSSMSSLCSKSRSSRCLARRRGSWTCSPSTLPQPRLPPRPKWSTSTPVRRTGRSRRTCARATRPGRCASTLPSCTRRTIALRSTPLGGCSRASSRWGSACGFSARRTRLTTRRIAA